MTIFVGGVVAVLLGLSRGGSFDSLARTRLRTGYLVIAGLVLQVSFAIFTPGWLTSASALAIVLVSNGLILAFIVLNRILPGMMVIGAGVLLNVAVIASNGAMPVSIDAIRVAGIGRVPDESSLKHEMLGPDSTLPWLGDVIPLPKLQEIVSVGDLVIVLGIGLLVYRRMNAEHEERAQISESPVGR